MKVLVITASPNKDGLTAACGDEAVRGAVEAGAEVEMVSLNDLKVGSCQACGNGWGPCLNNHECQVVDDFQKLHSRIGEADAFVFVTPVYWGEMSESTKAFTDRMRRCEAPNGKSLFEGKPVISVAAAGGSGNGTISCLASMERFAMHDKAVRFDLITITRKSREYKLRAIYEASKAMVINN
jgi:multimeric flavodoxin WrbA